MPSPAPAALTAFYAASATTTSLCVSLQASQASIKAGQTAQWIVSAWAQNGNIPSAVLQLTAAPTGQTPKFTFGCGSQDGTASCDLGTVFSSSTERQVTAQIAVPASATSLTSVQLTLTAGATGLTKEPSVSVAIPLNRSAGSTPSSSTSAPAGSTGNTAGTGSSSVSQLPVGSLPTIPGSSNGSSSSLSPGGNAAGLFPTLDPSAVPTPGPGGSGQGAAARAVANSEALPIGTPVIDAQVVGLAALGVAFLLAVTRMSVRRRPAGAPAGAARGPSTGLGSPAEPATAVLAKPASPAASPESPQAAQPTTAQPATAQPGTPGSGESTPTSPTVPDEAAAGATPADSQEPPTRPQPSVSGDSAGSSAED